MAKKTQSKTKKKTTKTPTRKKATSRVSKATVAKSAAKKKTSKKVAAKKTVKKAAKKATSKKATTRKVAPKKKAAAKKATSKKVTKKTVAKKTVKKAAKTASKKKAAAKTSKKTAAKSSASKKAPATKKAASSKKTATTKQAANSKSADAAGDKPNRKGITIVSDRPKKKAATKKPVAKFPPTGDRLLGPGSPVRKPLIPSGPSQATTDRGIKAADPSVKAKTPFNKKELDRFRTILLEKRAELFGDMSQMESGALRSNSGGLSHTPQHFAEQGSESYDQSLSLDLAAADRRLIMEIDDALKRIDEKTFGICELTGKPIKKTRLEELPWARYSIQAARELERRAGFRS